MDNDSTKNEKKLNESSQNLNPHLNISPKINKTSTCKKKYLNNNNNENFKKIFTHIFKIHIDTLFETFSQPSFLCNTFFNKTKIISISKNQSMSEIGNEIILQTGQYTFKLVVKNSENTSIYKSFTHKVVEKPLLMADFESKFNFYWDSIEQITIFQLEVTIFDVLYKNSISDYFNIHKEKRFQNMENYLINNINSFDQNETISINKDFNYVWDFLCNFNNLKYFFNNKNNIEINLLFGKVNEIELFDKEKNNKLIIMINKNIINDGFEGEILLQIVKSEIKIPNQKIIIKLVKIDDNSSLLCFDHKILQFLSSDILGSYSYVKMKSLWDIKNILEKES
jgi:hypothetical protein